MNSTARNRTRDLAYIAVFAALIVVMGVIAIPVGAAGVPLVLQNAVIILAGLVLGPRRGFLAVLLVLALGLVGLPVLSGGSSTLAALAGPTAGYVLAYPFSALIAGFVAYQAPRRPAWLRAVVFAAAAICGLLVQYAGGAVGLTVMADLGAVEAALAQVPFFFPALIEQTAMVAIALGVHAAFPDLQGRRKKSVTQQKIAV